MVQKKNITDFISTGIWEIDESSLTGFRAFAVNFMRMSIVVVREFTEGQLTLRAMGLVYTTLLSIVPLIAISFSILKGFGVHNQVVEPALLEFLAPLGEKGVEITRYIIGFVENMKVGVLGSLGLALLFVTVISVIQKVEGAFNSIWRIKKSRSFARRFSDYLSILLVGPVLLFIAISLTASISSNTVVQKLIAIEPFGTAFYLIVKIAPYIIVCAAFTFFYYFIPNTKVKLKSAFVGGFFAGVLWELTGWGFATFTVSSTKYAAIYSGFAILIMFMIWLYLNWLILLVGAQMSFLHQHPALLKLKDKRLYLSNSLKEKIALLIAYLISSAYHFNNEKWTLNKLSARLQLPDETVDEIVTLMESSGILIETNEIPPTYVPARDIDTISLDDVMSSVRSSQSDVNAIERSAALVSEVNGVMDSVNSGINGALAGRSIKDIVIEADINTNPKTGEI